MAISYRTRENATRPTAAAAATATSSDYTTYELDQVSVHDRVVPKERVLPAEPAVPIRE